MPERGNREDGKVSFGWQAKIFKYPFKYPYPFNRAVTLGFIG